MPIPVPSRPRLSGYVEPGKLLPWPWVEERLRHAPAYWIATHARHYPSSRPVWGIWHDMRLLFSSGSLIARHIASDPHVQANLEDSGEVVIIEGAASVLPVADVPTWVARYREKYHWDMPATVDDVYQLVPHRVLAWICDNSGLDGGVQFSNSATEWRFPH
jgi:hypothetical protein